MFDPDHFVTAAARVRSLLYTLSSHSEWSFGTLGLPVVMSGRGVSRDFQQSICRAFKQAAPSAHATLSFNQILKQDLPEALRDLRRAHGAASGGLPAASWQQGRMTFILANGGSVGLRYARPDFRPNQRTDIDIRLEPGRLLESLSERLARHARLDLSGPLDIFEIAERGNSALPLVVDAPDGPRALARLIALGSPELRKWVYVRKLLDLGATQAEALALLEE